MRSLLTLCSVAAVALLFNSCAMHHEAENKACPKGKGGQCCTTSSRTKSLTRH